MCAAAPGEFVGADHNVFDDCSYLNLCPVKEEVGRLLLQPHVHDNEEELGRLLQEVNDNEEEVGRLLQQAHVHDNEEELGRLLQEVHDNEVELGRLLLLNIVPRSDQIELRQLHVEVRETPPPW